MTAVRVLLLSVAAFVVPVAGFLCGVLVSIEGVDKLPGISGDDAIPIVGVICALTAYVAWFRLLRHIHWWQLDSMRRTATNVEAKVTHSEGRVAVNPRGPNSCVIRLGFSWADPKTGRQRHAWRAYGFPQDKAEFAAQFGARHGVGSPLALRVRPGLRSFIVDVPVLPSWPHRW